MDRAAEMKPKHILDQVRDVEVDAQVWEEQQLSALICIDGVVHAQKLAKNHAVDAQVMGQDVLKQEEVRAADHVNSVLKILANADAIHGTAGAAGQIRLVQQAALTQTKQNVGHYIIKE